MARPVRAREYYVAERAALTRLEEAVLRDTRIDAAPRAELLATLRQLQSQLSDVDANNTEKP